MTEPQLQSKEEKPRKESGWNPTEISKDRTGQARAEQGILGQDTGH